MPQFTKIPKKLLQKRLNNLGMTWIQKFPASSFLAKPQPFSIFNLTDQQRIYLDDRYSTFAGCRFAVSEQDIFNTVVSLPQEKLNEIANVLGIQLQHISRQSDIEDVTVALYAAAQFMESFYLYIKMTIKLLKKFIVKF